MRQGQITQFFAGGNTIRGFHSFFHYIPGAAARRLIIIKGGPGTGKSTLMKQLGQKAREAGRDTELFYCSSDNQSLDGLHVPELGFAMVDGTAPHVIDPRVPGAYDEILNLGDCWDAELLRPHKEDIAVLVRQNGEWFTQAYQYLKEAAAVMEKLRHLTGLAMDRPAVSRMTHQLLGEFIGSLPSTDEDGGERHLFGGANTPAGPVNFYPSIVRGAERLFLLTGDPGTGKSTLLQQVFTAVRRTGHRAEAYHCAFDPDRLDAVIVPAVRTVFIKVTYPHSFSLPPEHPVREQYTLALSRHARVSALRTSAAERAENQERLWYLLGKAVEMIRSAKQNHDRLESYYVRAMDFEKLSSIRERLTAALIY
jgi:ABC-type lipoprotein export system ATPase subunit